MYSVKSIASFALTRASLVTVRSATYVCMYECDHTREAGQIDAYGAVFERVYIVRHFHVAPATEGERSRKLGLSRTLFHAFFFSIHLRRTFNPASSVFIITLHICTYDMIF